MSLLKENLRVRELTFGVHLHVDLTLAIPLGEKFYREITKVRSDLFTTKFIQPGVPFVFLHEKAQNRCVITDNSIAYTEKKNFDSGRFQKVSSQLAEAFLESFESSQENVRILGKVYRYELASSGIFSAFKKAVALFADEEIYRLQIRTLLKKDAKNIHLRLGAIEKDGVAGEDRLAIECDINNADQDTHHSLQILPDIFKFADTYNQQELLPLLSKKLGIG